ncbi:MAG: hypothetical protein ACJA2Q_000836 [Pseudohongiellaceae bacterium]|jgi:hypothetical protein
MGSKKQPNGAKKKPGSIKEKANNPLKKPLPS